ncbi:MAG: zinc dependent phospholipase C family protein [Myxococcota bacterium]|jgi:hypothetical protein|nr:zinc dependent phospholipase C family protein [Myxococcota bacterium]
MAGTLLHITLAEKIVQDDRLPDSLRADVASQNCDFLLGCVLFDLPYFENLLGSGLRLLLEQPLILCETGTLLHGRDPVGLLEQLLCRADDPSSRALALGAVTHYSVDLVFHPSIVEMVAARNAPARQRDAVHKSIEDQVDLHVSFDLLGHSGVGTPYVTDKLGLVPHLGWAERFCEAAWKNSGVWMDTMSARRWLRRLHLFALIMRYPQSPFVLCLPSDDPALLATSLELSRHALELGVTHLLAAHRVITGDAPMEHLREILGSHSLTDGSTQS